MNAPLTQPPPFRSSLINGRLVQVEKLMHRLARRDRLDRAGSMVSEQLATGGKRIRARLALEACACFGVSEEDSIKWAAAIELLHNATLIHDDIQDGDTSRRGHPTIWASHGVPQAINAGDLMLMLPFLAVSELSGDNRAEVHYALARAATEIVRGQVEELDLRSTERLDVGSYVAAARGKTGALIALPVVGAALLAGLGPKRAEALGEYFVQLGVLFQVQDDVVDLFGDKGRGKSGCDIYEGKVSALLVAHLEASPETRDLVLDVIDRPREETTEADVRRLKNLFVLSGALDRVMDMIVDIRDEVLGSPLLLGERRLYELAESLIAMALAPLSTCSRDLDEGRAS